MKDPWKELEAAAKTCPPGYLNSKQMFDDFRTVFFGTEQGKRVFNQIMEWAGVLRNKVVKGDPYATYMHLGERNIGARVWLAIITEPKERPTQTVRRSRVNG